MGSTRAPTKSEIQTAFDAVIENPQHGIPTESGFNALTQAALIAYTIEPSEAHASRARVALKQQFEGTYDAHDDDDWDDAIRSVR